PLAMMSSATRLTTLLGRAKPTPIEPDDEPLDAMATFMPMNCPVALSRAPPEFPGLMEASV
ncbi:MAG: hypothetical protein RJA31_1093, partial [Actinomycetota bacterium]